MMADHSYVDSEQIAEVFQFARSYDLILSTMGLDLPLRHRCPNRVKLRRHCHVRCRSGHPQSAEVAALFARFLAATRFSVSRR